ncbi:MAG: ATP-binding response regulator [Janthinobacterium lividum]
MEERTLIFAPRGRDGQVIEQLLSQHAFESLVCASVRELIAQLALGAAAAVVTEEAIDASALASLAGWLSAQAVWSDFPFVILTAKRPVKESAPLAAMIKALGNVVLLERPVHAETLASAARSALRVRRRQYQARSLLAEREKAAADLLNADRRKDQFLAMLAHELRNPLAPIRSAAEVLKHVEADLIPQVRWARVLIERQSQHLSSLLEDLLDVSRINTGKITLQLTDVELNVLVAAAIESAKSALDARQHTLVLSLSDQPVFVRGDPVRLTQVFGNLLDNAVKYTPVGGRIEVASAVRDGWATVSIQDNGVGVSAEDVPHIFELFSQSNRALDRAQGGLGIGLSLVRSISAMHGGKTEVRSAGLGHGSCFLTHLPELASSALTVRPELPALQQDETAALNILVVDDNVDAAEALSVLLQMQGHHVRTAADGASGLEACAHSKPDVVLLDIGLPGMDGYEVAMRLRRQQCMRGVKLIAVTGYGQPEDVQHSIDAGFDHHIVKPVEPSALALLFKSPASGH